MTTVLSSPPEYLALANALRHDVLESTTEAGSGHPTSCLSCAEIMAVLFARHLRFDVSHPARLDNDHFILSKGHAAPILWAMMYRAGAVSESEMLRLRQEDSRLEGHPTPRSEWVRIATGSLGQGLSAGLGMAYADRLNDRPARTYVLLGDGEMAEGSCWEAAQLASHLELSRLCAIVDVNGRGQTGPTMLGHDLDTLAARFEAFGWRTTKVDGHDPAALDEALRAATESSGKPTAILARTIKGKGVPQLEGDEGRHGKPAADLAAALEALPPDELQGPIIIPSPDSAPQTAPSPVRIVELDRPERLFTEACSPREAFGDALREWGEKMESVLVFDGDVGDSTYTARFAEKIPERFLNAYIAEQNLVGMALGAGQLGHFPVVATFAAFFSRAFDQLRMAALSRARILCAGTHAGTATGPDGPSQMGLEDLALFRVLPGSIVLQPADGPASRGLLECLSEHDGIGYLRLFRPSVQPLYDRSHRFRIGGSHTLRQSSQDRLALLASGATVHTALRAADELAEAGIAARVIDLYSVKPIDVEALTEVEQSIGRGLIIEDHYPEGGLGEAIASVLPLRWDRWRHLPIRGVPRSGPAEALAARHGISVAEIVSLARELAG